MKIKTLVDEDFQITSIPFQNPRIRYGARGIVFNPESQIAILHKCAKNEYKLIGGGLEENETPEVGFLREVLEETGCVVRIDDFLGTIEEHKSLDNFQQVSYVYVGHVVEDTLQTNFTDQERGECSEIMWVDIATAMDLIQASENQLVASRYEGELSVYHSRFLVRRDLEILKYFVNQSCAVDIKKNYNRTKK